MIADQSLTSTHKSGYLFERRHGRVYQSWVRKYFTILNGELISTTRNPKPSSKEEDGVASINLRVCSVRISDHHDRRFCFEVISPNRVLVLQAENEQQMEEWISSIRTASHAALNSSSNDENKRFSQQSLYNRRVNSEWMPPDIELTGPDDMESSSDRLKKIRAVMGNDLCAECHAKDPEWACTNFGIVVCIECSGIHRSLGVQVSKVRSVMLDKWEPNALEVMLRLGNTVVNHIYEAAVPKHMETFRLQPDSQRRDRDVWIVEKYVKKTFVAPCSLSQESLNKEFWNAVVEGKLDIALKRLAQGADVNYRNPDDQLRTALHKGVNMNEQIIVEFLLQRLCNADQQDAHGQTALHYAAAKNNVRLVLTLLKRHAKADIQDHSDKTALDIALEKQNVQSVTALRLFAFDKQHNASPSSSFDFGFREAMSSFSNVSMDRPNNNNLGQSHSAVDLRKTETAETKLNGVLLDDQNSSLLSVDK
ncbi:hypothetical protein BDF20DRAFT_836322 [Mycotypha africana]|uniref:uncharacterized protein n=1 Tax=Mycotypha africana TaxID=64632 RepID=UPI00230151DD|nr:uncharacterized protein BDF20DRAFT_836322 [Mycotypha africana]KAI8977531.1 hypothetical protein BDF20DRAFT_836322 [Mycotypha africana]